MSLVGLLVVLAIMALLAVRILQSSSSTPSLDPDNPTETVVGSGTAAVAPADTAVCSTDRQTLEVAVQAYTVMNGSAPESQDQLVTSGLLAAPVPNYSLTAGASGAQVVGDGPCEGS